MAHTPVSCAVCGAPMAGSTSPVVVEGRPLVLCAEHAAILLDEPNCTLATASALLGGLPVERRGGESRRNRFDRRMFPRPEGRRSTSGRRATDR